MTSPVQIGPSVWYGPEVAQRESAWVHHFTQDELTELRTAAQKLADHEEDGNPKSISLALLSGSESEEWRHHFKLPLIQSRIAALRDSALLRGLGFFLWRGIPVEEWPYRTTCAAFLLIGKCMGNFRQQNGQGHVLGHVRDLGVSSADPAVRVYQTSERQTFHTDSCDVVGLLCLQTAKSGGRSALVSAGTVYNEILKKRPELAAALLQPMPIDRRGEIPKGKRPFYSIPVFNDYEGYFSVRYQRQYINSSQRFPDAPRLSPLQVEALNYFDATCDDPSLHFTMELRRGDVQFVYNHPLLHDRTAFVDWAEPERRRHLLRIWVATPGDRPLPPAWIERFGSLEVGNRGGITIEGVQPIAPLYATL